MMPTMKVLTGAGVGAVVVATAAAAAYPRYGRDACLHWGATVAEGASTMPGDELLERCDILSTRAITIDAPIGDVWPWLVQMGPGRGGAYTYDWVENLMGLGMHSADHIVPEWQDLEVGDVMALGESGPRMRVEILTPQTALVFASEDGNWVWAFTLTEGDDSTRLVSRNRIATPGAGALVRLMNTFVMEPGSLVMERKMLMGIKARAESLESQRVAAP